MSRIDPRHSRHRQSMRIARAWVVMAAAVVALLAPAEAGAAPASTPTVKFFMPTDVDAGGQVTFQFRSSNVPRGANVALQRQVGTGRVWRTVIGLPRNAQGNRTISAPAIGFYSYRLAVVKRGQTLAQRARYVRSFGTVPLMNFIGASVEGSYTFPTFVFKYAFDSHAGRNESAITVVSNKCRSVHLEWIMGETSHSGDVDATTATLSLVQEARDAVQSSGGRDAVVVIDSELDPLRTWSVVVNDIEVPAMGNGPEFLFNGTASCYATDGGGADVDPDAF